MRTPIASFLAFIGLSSAVAQSWPALPGSGFISGRPASERDISDGNAIFVLKSNDLPIGKPLQITIPQYAYLVEEGGKRTRVILVQAEEANGVKLFGIRDLGGEGIGDQRNRFAVVGNRATGIERACSASSGLTPTRIRECVANFRQAPEFIAQSNAPQSPERCQARARRVWEATKLAAVYNARTMLWREKR
jgi:hypothetical protein